MLIPFQLALSLHLSAPALAAANPAAPAATAEARQPVDILVVLDTSNSMDQLLDSARGRIWDIVNTLSRMRPVPELRVGLVTYGSPNVASEEQGYVVVRSDLTTDLDAIYAELMALETDGGDEWIGWALNVAVNDMSWSGADDALRVVFVAGNEPADQGPAHMSLHMAGAAADDAGIIINAIYAGARDQGITENWPAIALESSGTFSSIDPVVGTIQIATPQDDELKALNLSLNGTYLPYGDRGAAGLANQVAQDANATRLGVQACSSRVVSKGSSLYDNARWDLVDALGQADFSLEALSSHDLPESMRSMTIEQQRDYITSMRKERERIQDRIQALSAEREAFIKMAFAEQNPGLTSLDEAMKASLLEQARTKGFNTDGC